MTQTQYDEALRRIEAVDRKIADCDRRLEALTQTHERSAK